MGIYNAIDGEDDCRECLEMQGTDYCEECYIHYAEQKETSNE